MDLNTSFEKQKNFYEKEHSNFDNIMHLYMKIRSLRATYVVFYIVLRTRRHRRPLKWYWFHHISYVFHLISVSELTRIICSTYDEHKKHLWINNSRRVIEFFRYDLCSSKSVRWLKNASLVMLRADNEPPSVMAVFHSVFCHKVKDAINFFFCHKIFSAVS